MRGKSSNDGRRRDADAGLPSSDLEPCAEPRSGPWKLALPGMCVLAVCFGFARYGYGLFLPEMRRTFDVSTGTLGRVSAAGYAAEVVALIVVVFFSGRVGPRWLVGAGGLSAATGMLLIAVAPNTSILLVGVVLAGGSPGWVWAPFSDVIADTVLPRFQGRALAVVSSGTTIGVLAAGPAAVLTNGRWRAAWLVFALLGLVVTMWSLRVLPAGRPLSAATERPGIATEMTRLLRNRRAYVLFVAAFTAGLVGAVYWTYAGAAVSAAGGSVNMAPLLWGLIGLVGIAGLAAGDLIRRFGLRATYLTGQLWLVVSIAILAVIPDHWASVVTSAVIYGPTFMIVGSLLSVWNSTIFPADPSRGFALTLLILGAGSVAGPALLSFVADTAGLRLVFGVTAVIAGLTMLAHPRQIGIAPGSAADCPLTAGQGSGRGSSG